jgi:LPS-assembly lipoprotein
MGNLLPRAEVVPAMIKPALDVMRNRSYTGGPLIPRSLQDVVPEQQVLPATSSLARELQRTLEGSGSQLKVLRDPAAMPTAQVIMDLLQEQRERVVLGLNVSGQVRELQLRLRVKFRLRTQTGVEIIPDTELLQQRDISYTETAALAKEAEEALQYRDMQRDITQQVMRRLAAVTAP